MVGARRGPGGSGSVAAHVLPLSSDVCHCTAMTGDAVLDTVSVLETRELVPIAASICEAPGSMPHSCVPTMLTTSAREELTVAPEVTSRCAPPVSVAVTANVPRWYVSSSAQLTA